MKGPYLEKHELEQLEALLPHAIRDTMQGWKSTRLRGGSASMAFYGNVSSALLKAFDDLAAEIKAQQQAEPVADEWAKLLHYPDCWDTAAYPTLHDAVHEALAWSGCSVCELEQQAEPVQEPFDDLATELFVVAQISPADDGFSDTIDRIESWLREHFSTPPKRKELSAGEILNMMPSTIPAEYDGELMEFARAVEAKLKENT